MQQSNTAVGVDRLSGRTAAMKAKQFVARSGRIRTTRNRGLQTLARVARSGRPPRVLVNSYPKAGTHLVTQLLDDLPQMRFTGWHIVPDDFTAGGGRPPSAGEMPALDWERVTTVLRRIKPGQYLTAHFSAYPRFLELLQQLEYRTVFVYRDPRDLAVSMAMYVARLSRHEHHRRYSMMDSDAARLLATIIGFEPSAHERGLRPIGEQLRNYLGWLGATDDVLCCRFEELVGARGGGTDQAQVSAIRDIAAHVGRPLAKPEATEIAARAWSSGSVTFRRGVAGDWANRFDAHHAAAFAAQGGEDLLREYGYESGLLSAPDA